MGAFSANHNVMSNGVSRQLRAHYGRLNDSVRRLSSGLRVERAADDAAGLAIRELMRADIQTLGQGARNACDAVSLIQVADGALQIIDEKLIRMKELAEQAATGTYDSIQRLMIESEYQAMASEIDRIANFTDFNGVKLLDGSLSGRHDGSGLTSRGALKVHFGTANDSAEDYDYITIGNCTAAALGVGNTAQPTGPTVTREKVETVTREHKTFTPQGTDYVEYVDPDTGNKYYTDGNYWFTDLRDPGGSALDWETDKVLDPNKAADKAIIDRLESTNTKVQFTISWKAYRTPDGKSYFSYNDGKTFTSGTSDPAGGALDPKDPDDRAIIDSLKPDMVTAFVYQPTVLTVWELYEDPQSGEVYYTRDGGKSFVADHTKPNATALDPVADKDLISRLVAVPTRTATSHGYDTYEDKTTGKKYYTDDGKNFITDVRKPDDIALSADDPKDAAAIANLEVVGRLTSGSVDCSVYEDTGNGNRRWYSDDGGATFFDDPTAPKGSRLDAGDPDYATVVARLQKLNMTATISKTYAVWKDPATSTLYYTHDGGQTFYKDTKGKVLALDRNDPNDLPIINSLVPDPSQQPVNTTYDNYRDPVTGQKYYTLSDGGKDIFITNVLAPHNVALDAGNPADKPIIDRLEPIPDHVLEISEQKIPDKYFLFRDTRTGKIYYSPDEMGTELVTEPNNPAGTALDPTDPADKAIIDNLEPVVATRVETTWIERVTGAGRGGIAAGYTSSTQEAAQRSLVAIDNAIVSKDRIRAHLGALQNRLENTITNLNVQAESLQAAESRISDVDVAEEMTVFVRNQVLMHSASAILTQANAFPHMILQLLEQ